jgi:hypothetical protein
MAVRNKGCLATVVSAVFTGVVAPVLVNLMTYRMEHEDAHRAPPPAASPVDWSRPQAGTSPPPVVPNADGKQQRSRGWEGPPQAQHGEWSGSPRR